MGKTLLGKEIRNHLLSFRFLAVSVMLLVIVPVTVLVLANDTIRKQDEYSLRRNEIENYLTRYAHFNRINNVIRPSQPPIPFQALVRGISDDTSLDSFNNDPLPVLFPMIDLTFILAILLSLAALIFTYDAISGEKEDGTLKLMLANGLSRSKIVLAKLLGSLATLMIPFLLSLAAGMILVLLNPRIAWKGSDWGALGLILLGGVLYLGLFCCLGILVSSRHASSSASILTTLFVWVLLVLVVPNISPYVASLIRPAPSVVKVNREIDRLLDTDRDELARKLRREKLAALIREYPVLAGIDRMNEATIKAEIGRNPDYARAYDMYRKEMESAVMVANTIQNAKANVLRVDLNAKEKAQTSLSFGISMISPLAAFTYLSADLSNTGTRNRAHFGTLTAAFWASYDDYSRPKMEAMRKADPTVDIWNTAVDVHDMPRFIYKEEALSGRIAAVLWPAVLLIGLNLAVFVVGVLSFNKTDVR